MSIQYTNINRYKNYIYARELVNGKEQRRKVKIEPYLFQRTNNKTEYKDFYNRFYLEKKNFSSPYQMKEFMDLYSSIPDEIWGNTDVITQFIYSEKYDSNDSSNIVISYLDIEVCTRYQKDDGTWVDGGFPNADEAKFPINAICDYRSDDKKYHVFTTAKGWTKENSKLKYASDVIYTYCETEVELVKRWLNFWMSKTPHIVTGWNNLTFDIPYIVNRMKILFGNIDSLSPWGVVTPKNKKDNFGNDLNLYDIMGVAVIDYLDLYKKYRYIPRERYTLDYISRCENPDEHKLEFKGTHGSLYYDDPVFFVDYNIQDVRCVVCFERDLQFMNLVIYLSYYSGINFEDNFSPIKIWETLIYKTAEDRGYIIPIKSEGAKKESYEGAYVHEPVPGLKGCVASFDFTSLYPSIMLLFYIGADVHVTGRRGEKLRENLIEIMKNDESCKKMLEEIEMTGVFNSYYIENDIPSSVTKFLQKENVSLTTNVEFYDVSRDSIFVSLIQKLFAERKSDKKKSFEYKHKAHDIKEELEKRGIKV